MGAEGEHGKLAGVLLAQLAISVGVEGDATITKYANVAASGH